MKKRFISKKSKQIRMKTIFLLGILAISFAVSLSFFASFFSKEKFLHFLLANNLFTETSVSTNIFDFLLEYTIGTTEEDDDYYDGSASKQEYTPDPNPEENKEDPLIYLYNTHQGEEYNGGVLSEYNVIPTVMLAAYRLREQLNNYGLNTIVETNNISEILRSNGWNYNSSYSASKILMTNALEENPTLKYFIDVHRDALPYESSILTYEGKTYAKVLLVIGQNHPGYLSNLALSEEVSNLINSKVPGLSKGVMQKPSSIFNQDFSPNTLLIEFGGQYNKISEINNTVAIVAEVLKEVITE